jgi:hypothetical protein
MRTRSCVYLTIALLYFNSINLNAQLNDIYANDLFEIIDLYVEGQYEVVYSKLSNLGFELTKSTPDYTSKNIDYKGDFMMVHKYICPADVPPEYKDIIQSYIKFSTNADQKGIYITITFRVVMSNAQYVFNNTVEEWWEKYGPIKSYTSEYGGMIAQGSDTNEYYGKYLNDPTILLVYEDRFRYTIRW